MGRNKGICHEYDLAERIRKAYKDGDRLTLSKIAEYDLPECIERTRRFHRAFRNQWFEVNKATGFEVQEARLGGVILRTESCLERLRDYIAGKTDRIEELEDDVLSNDQGGMNEWARMISANVI